MKPTKEQFTARTQVSRVFEKKIKQCVSGSGETAVFSEISGGWWIVIDGLEWFVGEEKPLAQQGNKVTVTLSVTL